MDTITTRPDLLAVAHLVQPGEKVLDLGCGDGLLLHYLKERKQVTARGVELHEAGVLACVQKASVCVMETSMKGWMTTRMPPLTQ